MVMEEDRVKPVEELRLADREEGIVGVRRGLCC
jgi:hypothetical protein